MACVSQTALNPIAAVDGCYSPEGLAQNMSAYFVDTVLTSPKQTRARYSSS